MQLNGRYKQYWKCIKGAMNMTTVNGLLNLKSKYQLEIKHMNIKRTIFLQIQI